MIFAFFWHAALAQLSMAEPKSWVLWTDLDGADFFWTSSNCSTMVLPDSGIVGNAAPVAPSNGGISDMLFFPDTHEVLWLEGGHLVRAWMDKTERAQLAQLPGDANETELSGNGTGPMLGSHGEDGAISWTMTSDLQSAVLAFASKVTQKLWMTTLSSLPPRDAAHLGPWVQIPGAEVTATGDAKPVLLASEGQLYWSDSQGLRSWDLALSAGRGLAELGAWGEVLALEVTGDGSFLWIRLAPAESRPRLEVILSMDELSDGPTTNYASGNVRTLHTFLEGDQVSGLAVQPSPGSGLPYRGNVTRLYQQVYWSVSGPAMQARIDHLDMATGHVSTLSYAAGLERRGAPAPRPSALRVYPMPDVCVNVGCLYLRIWEECRICTEDQCDTCFLDTQDWVVKQWYASHGLFSNCIWLWPPQQGAWFVRSEVQQAKDDGLLPDDFVAQELPPDGATPPGHTVATVPPTRTHTTATVTTTSTGTSATKSSTTSTSVTLSSTNPCVAIDVPLEGLSETTCSDLVDSWCQDISSQSADAGNAIAPLALRRDCATYPWSFKELCPSAGFADGTAASCEVPPWSYAIFAAGLALLLATLVPCCYAIRRKRPHTESPRGATAISSLRNAALERGAAESKAVPGSAGPRRHCWDCRRQLSRWIRRREPSKRDTAEVDDGDLHSEVRRKSWEATDGEPGSGELVEVETDTPPENSWQSGSRRPSGAEVEPEALTATGVQQILKGTWQPGISSSSAALAAGRLTDLMQKFMSPSTRQGDEKWRMLHDVEDILRTLGSALPGNLRSAAWAWHARQSGRLHRSQALAAAEDEAKSIAEDFREDLSQRLQSGVRRLEAEQLVTGASSLHAGAEPDANSASWRFSASKLQMSVEQLKRRMEDLPPTGSLISAGHLLDGYESLMALSKELKSAQQKAGPELSETDREFWDQLSEEMKQLQEVLEQKLEGSGVPPGAWQKPSEELESSGGKGSTKRNQAIRSDASWLKGLKQATARAARFAHALKGPAAQDKKQLQEMEGKLLEELTSCEAAAAKAGDSEQSSSWRQVRNLWTQLQDQLDQARKKKLSGEGETPGGRLSSWAMSRSKLMPKRSHTQPLQMKEMGPEWTASAAKLQQLQGEVEIFRKKLREAENGGNRLLMAGRQHLQQQDLDKLLQAARAGESHSARLTDEDSLGAGHDVSGQWQQLCAELEDLEGELALDPTQRPSTSGRLSMGIGSRLSPKRSKQASRLNTSQLLPQDLLEASSALARLSEDLQGIRSQQAQDDRDPMLVLGQSVYAQQALESMELEVAKALQEAAARGSAGDEDWTSLRQLLQGLQAEIAQVKETAELQEQKMLPGQVNPKAGLDLEVPKSQSGLGRARRTTESKVADEDGGQGTTRLSATERENLQSFLETLQQSLQGDDDARLACEQLGLKPTDRAASGRQAWSVGDEETSEEGQASLGVWPARLSSKDRSALLSKISDLQRQVEAGDADALNKLEDLCRQLGIEVPARLHGRPEDPSFAWSAMQKRMASLEEQLELQREGLQRQRRKSVQAPVVLAGHSLLHQSLLAAAAKEHGQCRAEGERLQAGTGLEVQSNGVQQLLKGCEDSSLRLHQGLLQAADGDAVARTLLSVLADEPSATAHLSVALQRLARLEDQVDQHRAALGARGRRRRGAVDDEILRRFLEEKNEALAALKDAAKDLLDATSSQNVYDAWQSQLTSALELMLATGIAVASDDQSQTSPTAGDPATAMAEARQRLAKLEDAVSGRRKPKLKAGSTFAELDGRNLSHSMQLLEEGLVDLSGDQARRDQMRRLVEHLEQQSAAAKAANHDRRGVDNEMLDSLLSERADLLQWIDDQLKQVDDPLLRQLRDLCQAELVISDLDGPENSLLADAKRRLEALEALEAEAAAEHSEAQDFSGEGNDSTRKKTFTDDDLLSELEEAERRLGRFDAELEKQRANLKRRRKKGEAAAVDPELLASLVAERAQLVDWAEDRLRTTPEDSRLQDFRHACRGAARRLERLVMAELAGPGAPVDPSALLAEARRRLLMLEEEGKQRLQRRVRPGCTDEAAEDQLVDPFATKKARFEDPDWRPEMEEARRRLARFDAELEKQRSGLQRRRKNGEEAFVDEEVLASLVSERAALVEWAEDKLSSEMSDDPQLQDFRHDCRASARRLEQLVAADLAGRGAVEDPSALLAEARRRLLMLEEEGKQRLQRRVRPGSTDEAAEDQLVDPLATKKARFEDPDWRPEMEEARRRLARFDAELEKQRNGLQRRRKNGEEAFVDEEVLASLVSERAELVEWAEDKLSSEMSDELQDFRHDCRASARRLEQLVVADLGGRGAAEDPSALLAEARRRLILMEEEAAKQRLKRRQVLREDRSVEGSIDERRRKNGEEAFVDEEVLAPLVSERAELVERAEDKLRSEMSDDPQLQDPSALRAERRSSPRKLRTKVFQEEDDRDVLMADAARRLARLEEELESQRQGLCRRRLQPKNSEAPEVLAAHALSHESSIQMLKQQHDDCRSDCERLLQAAHDGAWSAEQRASCRELEEKCKELEETWISCADSAEALKEEVAEAMPSRLTALLRKNDSHSAEASAALAEAMRRVATFDHEVEQQRNLMRRRKAAGAEDAVLTALLEEKQQAVAQCEEMAQKDEAWEDLQLLWQGPLTNSLVELSVPATKKVESTALAEKDQALAEARRRLERLDEESQRQRLGLAKRAKRRKADQAAELHQLVESGTEFAHLAAEHREGLNQQQNNIQEVIASDRDALEEIESWRQMAALEELQVAAGKMSDQLATISEETPVTTVVEGPGKTKRLVIGEVTSDDTSAAKNQCQEMQVRLREMREDEEERQRLLLQRRRKVKEPPEYAERAAQLTEENSRDLLLKAHDCIIEGNPGDVQALRQQLHELRADAFNESKEEPPGSRATTPAANELPPRPPPKEELEVALAESTRRMDLVNSVGADLLSQLEAVFSSEATNDLGSEVLRVVERWRGQLPQRSEAAYVEQLGFACEDAAKVVHGDDVEAQKNAFMAAYRESLSRASQATQVQAEEEEQGLRARAAARRRRRAEAKENRSLKEVESPARPSTSSPTRASRRMGRQSTTVGFVTTEAEVQNLRKTGEGFARSFFLQTEEEDEEQARRMVRRLESRSKSRSRPGTANVSPETSPLRRGLTHSLSMTASSWAWSPTSARGDGIS